MQRSNRENSGVSSKEQTAEQLIDLSHEIYGTRGLRYDSEQITLNAVYVDQLSAYRARRGWAEALEKCFLLEKVQDFEIQVKSDYSTGEYTLQCQFHSACARYAFWRLTHDQAPEAQYLIETAHIPESEGLEANSIIAPDMQEVEPSISRGGRTRKNTLSGTMLKVLRDLVRI